MEDCSFGPLRVIAGENRGRYPNCHSLYIEGAGVLIDPASSKEKLLRLRSEEDVRMVWLSHWHEDHFMHLDLFDDLPLWLSERDAPPLAEIATMMDWYGFNTEERLVWGPLFKEQFHYRSRKPSRCLMDGETVIVGELSVKVIATPGHTPGHISLFFPELSVLFVGDYDLTSFGPWYGDIHSDIDQTRTSLSRLRNIQAEVIIAGHETGIFHHPPEEIWHQYESVIDQRENKLLSLLESPKTLDEIVAACIIYGRAREPKAFFEFGERVHMIKHLDHLNKRGLVASENGLFRRVNSD